MTLCCLLEKVQTQILVLTKPNFPALFPTKPQKNLFQFQQEFHYVPTGLIHSTHLLKTFLQPAISLFLCNLSNSYPFFKELIKCHLLWKNETGCVIPDSWSPCNTLDHSCDIYTILLNMAVVFTLAWNFCLLPLPGLEIF
jgi:hypothetical protein